MTETDKRKSEKREGREGEEGGERESERTYIVDVTQSYVCRGL